MEKITPNTKRGFGSAGLILVILIILGGGVYLWSQKSVPDNVPTDNSFKTLPAPDETASWKTYRNEEYGFEFKRPSLWRVKPDTPTAFLKDFLKNTNLTQDVYATVDYQEMLTQYTGTPVFDIWFQNPQNDMKPILEQSYKYAPQYYQYSNYNSAPLGIFIYVYKNGKTRLQNWPNKPITIDGIAGYRSVKPVAADQTAWATELVEIEKNNNLFLIFYAGDQYRFDFDQILSTFRFTK